MVLFLLRNMNEQVVLVDENDNKVGLMDKLEAHRGEGKLHRAISVLLWRQGKEGKEVLLQKRAATKPLWPLFWSNTVCTHPRDGESRIECAVRRVSEEMGIPVKAEELTQLYTFIYQARYNEKFSEHELDGVILGKWKADPTPNPEEAADWKWIGWEKLLKEMKYNSDQFTPWFQLVVNDSRIKILMEEVGTFEFLN